MNQYWKNNNTKRKFIGDSSDDDDSFINSPIETIEEKTKTISTQTDFDKYDIENQNIFDASFDDHINQLLTIVVDLDNIEKMKNALTKEKIIRKLILKHIHDIRNLFNNNVNKNDDTVNITQNILNSIIKLEELEDKLEDTVKIKNENFKKLQEYKIEF